jgi:hypothetical protein
LGVKGGQLRSLKPTLAVATYFYHTDTDSTEKAFKLSMRQFFPQELDALLGYNGFEIIAKYGDDQFTPFEQKPFYQNVLCRSIEVG